MDLLKEGGFSLARICLHDMYFCPRSCFWSAIFLLKEKSESESCIDVPFSFCLI